MPQNERKQAHRNEAVTMALSKNTKFWGSRIAIMVAVFAAALGFILYAPKDDNGINATSADGANAKPGIASNMERFYAEFSQISSNPLREQFGESTIELSGKNDLPIDKVIEVVSGNTYPTLSNWSGVFKERAFAAGSTIMQEAHAHAAQEGFNLVWDLPQDFKIKNRYLSTANLTQMLEDIAQAVTSNFDKPVSVYFCSDKRAFVITLRKSDYLRKRCQKTSGSF